jgi:putative hydrolase of the HAD superfamily
MKIRCVLFGIDDVLYDASLQLSTARLNAIKAMIEAGLPTDLETTYRTLENVVKERGPDYNKHFDTLLEKLGLKWNPRVIAAGVAAYRETSSAYLKPYAETFPTLLKLREAGYKVGVVSEGRAVKQWQKLIQLGIQHLFNNVITPEQIGAQILKPELFKSILKTFKVQPKETIFIGNKLETDILFANKAKIITVRIRKGEHRTDEPKSIETTPNYEINRLSEVFKILEKIVRALKAETWKKQEC